MTVLSGTRALLPVSTNNLRPLWSPAPGVYEVFLVVKQTDDLTAMADDDEVPSSHYMDVVEYNEQLIAELFLIGKERSEEEEVQAVTEAIATVKQLSSQAEELNQSGESDIWPMFEFPIAVAPLTWM